MVERKVENAARQVLGSVPSSWNVGKIAEKLENLKPLAKWGSDDESQADIKLRRPINIPLDAIPPPATYLMWLQRNKGLKAVFYPNSVMSEDNIKEFEHAYMDMVQDALLTAELDVANFVAETEITPVSDVLKRSVLSISSLYKYLAAQEHSLEFLLSDDMILRAIKDLWVNPYLYFSYGEDAITLMPVKWEDL